jgi:hypothetical protein
LTWVASTQAVTFGTVGHSTDKIFHIRIVVEGEEARSVEAAISILSVSEATVPIDRHPEKRMKAAYEDFEKVCWTVLCEVFNVNIFNL